jgi:hypothetical protein
MYAFDRAEHLAQFPMDLCHIMAKNLIIAPSLIKANIDEALMSRHIMVLMIFRTSGGGYSSEPAFLSRV